MQSSAFLQRPNLWTRYAQLRVLGAFARKFRAAVDQEGFATTDGTLGIEVTGTLDESLFHAIADSIPDGTWEFVCHPGYNDAELDGVETRLRASREVEREVLTSQSARQILADQGVELISYHQL